MFVSIFYSSCCSLLSQDSHSFPLRSSFKFCLPPPQAILLSSVCLQVTSYLASSSLPLVTQCTASSLGCPLLQTCTSPPLSSGFHPGICLCCNRFSLWNFIFGAICYTRLGCLICSHPGTTSHSVFSHNCLFRRLDLPVCLLHVF